MRFFFLILIISSVLIANTNSKIEQQYRDARLNFIKASLEDNNDKKIKELKQIIRLGKILKKDTRPDEKRLQVLESRNKKVRNESNKQNNTKTAIKTPKKEIIYPIRDIETLNNQIIVDFNSNVTEKDINYFKLKPSPLYRDVFDINGFLHNASSKKLSLKGIKQIIVGQNQPNKLRIVISDDKKQNISYKLNNKRLIITINNVSNTNNSLNTQNNQKQIMKTSTNTIANSSKISNNVVSRNSSNKKQKIIVIDPGHGGKDVGAVGPYKRYEKVVTLHVSRMLESELKKRGYKVYLTRKTDVFIKVMDRTVLANEKNADLFLSIHANSVPKEKANETSGVETFFLSPARSERAKRVAAQENKDDIREMNENSKSVFLESLNRPRITASHKFAIDVQSGILQAVRSKYKNVNDSGVKEGPFWVLVGAQMPSILIELGFISHPEESRRLYEKNYQQLLAIGIANGIDSYFLKNP